MVFVKGPQIANPQTCKLIYVVRFAALPQMWYVVDLRFADPDFLIICGLKTSASPQIHIFSPMKYKSLIQICTFQKEDF
jgi:hypothetical protein